MNHILSHIEIEFFAINTKLPILSMDFLRQRDFSTSAGIDECDYVYKNFEVLDHIHIERERCR